MALCGCSVVMDVRILNFFIDLLARGYMADMWSLNVTAVPSSQTTPLYLSTGLQATFSNDVYFLAEPIWVQTQGIENF